jgi:hypothetical protein
MRSNLTGNGLGGGLLGDLAARFEAAAERARKGDQVGGCFLVCDWRCREEVRGSRCVADGSFCLLNQRQQTPQNKTQAHFYRLLLTSGHYNTQLGLLAALQANRYLSPAQLPWLATIPATSSILVFELHHDVTSHELAVRLVIQNGPKSDYVTVPLPQCAVAGDAAEQLAGPGACRFEAFVKSVGGAALPSASEWCAACANTKMNACVAARVRGSSGSSGGGGGEAWKLAVAVLASVAGTAAAAWAAFVIHQRRAARRWEAAAQQGGGGLAGLADKL